MNFVLFILYLIICIIIYVFYILFLIIIPLEYIPNINKYFSTLFIKSLQFKSLNVINKNIYDKLINDNNNDKPLIIISNHSSLFDGIILTSILGNICFLADINGLSMPGSLFINKKLGSIIINNNDIGNSHKITNYIVNRKKKDNFLIIFPDAMQPIPINSVIAPFKSGAFKDFFDILPIVIKYKNYSIDPTHFWFKGENIFNGFCKMILEDNCDIYVKILNIQERLNNEDIEDYKNRIHKIISDEYEKL